MSRRFEIPRMVGAIAAVSFAGSVSAQNLDVKGTTTGEGNAYFFQKVGIGTTAPAYRLTLSTPTGNDGLQVVGNQGLWAAFLANLGTGSYNPIAMAGDRGIVYGSATAGSPGGGLVIAPYSSNGATGLRLDANGRLAVGGSGQNVYATDVWVENNMHVQGNETLVMGGRGRLRLGTAWGYLGVYAESAVGRSYLITPQNDLVLGASSGRVRVGTDSAYHDLWVSGTVRQKVRDVATGAVNAHSLTFTGFSGSQPYIEALLDSTYVGFNVFWSSRRFKKHIRDLQFDTRKIGMLRPVEFEWNEAAVPAKGKSLGLIAEEVYDVFPELVVMREGAPFSVNYELLSVVLLAEVKAQRQEALAVQGVLKSQQAEIEDLKKAVRLLQAKLN